MKKMLFALAALALGCSATPRAAAPVTAAPSASSSSAHAAKLIDWQPWGPDAFAKAKRENKLVLVDVGIEGCSACRWMHEGTYANAAIAKQIREGFIAVSIDADVQPDLGERFEEWGWPATLFFDADGQQLRALRGNRSPKVFGPILDELRANPRAEPAAATAKAVESPATAALDAMCTASSARLDSLGDDWGWGGHERIAFAAPVQHAFLRAHAYGETAQAKRALGALTGQTKILDPVWGGVFVAALEPNWDNAIVEKRTVQEANALMAFAEGYHATGDARWLDGAKSVHKYLTEWMRAPDGSFYSTQQDDAPNLPENMSAGDYYKLPDAQRRKYGIPPIDHAVYTDQNGPVIAAYVRLYEATGDRSMLEIAKRATDVLLAERKQPNGVVFQNAPSKAVSSDARLRAAVSDGRAYLRTQGEMGMALVALAGATGDARYLTAATEVAKATRSELGDSAGGGFFAATPRPTDTTFERRKPFAENVLVARFFVKLAQLTDDAEHKKTAESTLRAIATPTSLKEQVIWGVAPYTLLLEEMSYEPIEITIVTTKPDPRADELFARAVRLYEPRKVVRFAAPGKYPDRGRPTLHVCTSTACSKPVTDPAEVAKVAAPFLSAKTEACVAK